MSTRTCGLVWRKANPDEAKKGQCQLLTIKLNGRFKWSHDVHKPEQTVVWPQKKLTQVLNNALNRYGGYWIGPEEMSGWEDD